jgi:DNA-binding LacI/PurR family transcriptional regulator
MTPPPRDRTQTGSDRRRAVPTIETVAAAAGVSKTTVSHVLSGRRPVAPATRARVERVIAELGFRPSAVARSLSNARSHTVALLVPDVTNPFYPALARGLQEAVRDAGYLALLGDAGGSAEQERAFVEEAVSRRVDGLVLSTFQLEAADLAPALTAGITVVAIGPQLGEAQADVVSADDARIAVDAVAHLVQRGHRRIATVTGPADVEPGRGRLQGFHDGVRSHGLPTDAELVRDGGFTREGGHAATAALLALDEPPTAIFCANDLMAIGALDALRGAGLRVPTDVAVIGVDDIDAAALVTPALSTVRVPAQEIGHAAGQLLLSRLDGTVPPARQTVLVAHELIARDST